MNNELATDPKVTTRTVAGQYKVRDSTHASGAVSTEVFLEGEWHHIANHCIGKPDSMMIVRYIHTQILG